MSSNATTIASPADVSGSNVSTIAVVAATCGLVTALIVVAILFLVRRHQRRKLPSNREVFMTQEFINPVDRWYTPSTAKIHPQIAVDAVSTHTLSDGETTTASEGGDSDMSLLDSYVDERRRSSGISYYSAISDDIHPPQHIDANFLMVKKGFQIEFNILFDPKLHSINVLVNNITGLYIKYRKYTINLELTLTTPSKKKEVHHCIRDKLMSTLTIKTFSFYDIWENQIANSSLEFVLIAKRKIRERCLGKLNLSLSDVKLEYNQPITFQRSITPTKTYHDKIVENTSGSIYISLEYQWQAQRLKVFIKKADNLPDTKGVESPRFYCVISLCHTERNDIVEFQNTNNASSVSPVWNSGKLFSVKDTELPNHWVNVTVMRSRRFGSNTVVGNVILAKDANDTTAAEHWSYILLPGSTELTKWHAIQHYQDRL